jgi:hypothetical protein
MPRTAMMSYELFFFQEATGGQDFNSDMHYNPDSIFSLKTNINIGDTEGGRLYTWTTMYSAQAEIHPRRMRPTMHPSHSERHPLCVWLTIFLYGPQFSQPTIDPALSVW